MEDTFLFSIVQLPAPYPPDSCTEVIGRKTEAVRVTVEAGETGSLSLRIEQSGEVLNEAKTIPLQVEGEGPVMLGATFGEEMSLRINGKEVSMEDSGDDVFRVDASIESEEGLSIEQPQATEACKSKIDWRVNEYREKRAKPDNPHLRPKTHVEQIQDLRQAVLEMDLLLRAYNNEEEINPVCSIASILRSLIVWDIDHGGDGPLLLRIASRTNPPLPLPVYADPNAADGYIRHAEEGVLPEPETIITNLVPSLEGPTFGRAVIFDIQDWLESTSVIWDPNKVENPEEMKALSNQKLIKKVSGNSGSAHYTEKKIHDIRNLRGLSSRDETVLDRFIAGTGAAVTGLSQYVLSHVNSRGKQS